MYPTTVDPKLNFAVYCILYQRHLTLILNSSTAIQQGPQAKLLTVLLWLVVLVKTGLALWFVRSGFDLTDEGCYMLWYKYPDTDPHPFYYFHKMVLGFLPFVDWDIISLRLLKFVGDWVVILLISGLIWRVVKRDALFIIAAVGLGFCTTIFSRIFYEGDMSHLLVVLSLSIPFFFYQDDKPKRFSWGILLGAVFIGLQFFNKFSASVVSFGLLLAVIFYLKRGWVPIINLLAGTVIGAVLFFMATGYSPAGWWAEYKAGYMYVIEPLGYDPLGLLLYYGVDMMMLLFLSLVPLLINRLIRRLNTSEVIERNASVLFAGVVMLFMVVYYVFLPRPYSDAHYQHQSVLLNYWYVPMIAGLLYQFFYANRHAFSRVERALMVILFLMPGISLVGTGTSMAVSLSAYLSPWFGLLVFLYLRSDMPKFRYYYAMLAAGTLLMFSYFQLAEPFRQVLPVTEQNQAVEGPNETIYLGKYHAGFVAETKAILQDASVPPQYPMVALHNLPGLVYLVGGYSPATPWYVDVSWLEYDSYVAQTRDFNCLHIGRIKLFERRLPVFMIHTKALADIQACLKTHGFDLKKDYQKPVAVYDPFLQKELQALDKEELATLEIYIPKDLTD